MADSEDEEGAGEEAEEGAEEGAAKDAGGEGDVAAQTEAAGAAESAIKEVLTTEDGSETVGVVAEAAAKVVGIAEDPTGAGGALDSAIDTATGISAGPEHTGAVGIVDTAFDSATVGAGAEVVDAALDTAVTGGPVGGAIADAIHAATGGVAADAVEEAVDAAALGPAGAIVEEVVEGVSGAPGEVDAAQIVMEAVYAATGEEPPKPGEKPESEAELVAGELKEKLLKAATGEDAAERVAAAVAAEGAKRELVEGVVGTRGEALTAAKTVEDMLLSALEKKLPPARKDAAEAEAERRRMLLGRRASWKMDEETALELAEHVTKVKKERRPGYKNPMGGITQVPWTPTKRRGPIAAEYQSPGPACVTLPNLTGGTCGPDSKRNRAPAFSFGSRPGGKQESPGPGPGQYNVTGLSAKGKDNPPASSLHSRPKEIKFAQTPAPGDYNPEKSEKIVHASPKFTFGLKTQPGKPSTTPAPNVYNIPTVLGATKEGNKKQAPAFTISGRQKDKPDDRINNPGPGSYNDAKADNYKAKSPAYSISSRYQMPCDPSPKPGPGAHSPEKVFMNLRWAPNYSFGIKHSQFKGDKGFKLVQDTSKSRCTCTC